MDIKLIIQAGARVGQQIPIDVHEFLIGRDVCCQYQIDHSMVDLKHARIHLFGSRVSITDLKTENGTAVNDKYIRTAELKHGDRIKVGPTTFLVSIEEQPKDLDRRVEFWCANTLEARSRQSLPTDQMESLVDSQTADVARKILGKLSSREGKVEGRARLRVGESRGITVIKFVDNALVQDTDIQEVEQELIDLVDSGRRRIVLHFGNVENMSSQVATALVNVHKLCADRGGLLKICKLAPKVESIFAMFGLDKVLEIHRDERPALEGEWPGAAPAAPAGADGSAFERSPLDEVPAAFAPMPAPAPPARPAAAPARPLLTRVGLIVEGGRSDGKFIEIPGTRFFIGGDASCNLRPKSPQVGPMHAVIERREGKVFVRDLGSAAGTGLAGRTLHGKEAEAAPNDRLQIGPLSFRFVIETRSAPAAPPPEAIDPMAASWLYSGPLGAPAAGANSVDDLAASWLFEAPKPRVDVAAEVNKRLAKFADVTPVAAPPPPPAPNYYVDEDDEEDEEEIPEAPEPPKLTARPGGPAAPALSHIHAEVFQDILVVKVLKSDLNDEGTVAPIRAELQALFERELPRRVVLDLGSVTYLSSRAVGVFLAYYQRLERAGGKLRLAQVRPRVLPILEQMRLTMLIDVFPTIEDALLQAW